MRRIVFHWLSMAAIAALLPATVIAQGVGLDRIAVGPIGIHDHVVFDYHFRVLNDPFPHEVKEGYAFDGADVGMAINWHWNKSQLQTRFRVTPASRTHFAYDQDTDFEPNTNFTHGNEGNAKSRTFGVGQSLPLFRLGHWGAVGLDEDFLRQWTRYHRVTTYDLNSNPALPSNSFTRLISEQAIIYEVRSTLTLTERRQWAGWTAEVKLGATPASIVLLHNYIPVVLAATSTEVYGGSSHLAIGHGLGKWGAELLFDAGRYNSYHSIAGFRREQFSAEFLISR
ncbi:MAG TPA: hypothetical protein VIC32_07855 [Terriglobales bacterium]